LHVLELVRFLAQNFRGLHSWCGIGAIAIVASTLRKPERGSGRDSDRTCVVVHTLNRCCSAGKLWTQVDIGSGRRVATVHESHEKRQMYVAQTDFALPLDLFRGIDDFIDLSLLRKDGLE